jgi:hypothetical protein
MIQLGLAKKRRDTARTALRDAVEAITAMGLSEYEAFHSITDKLKKEMQDRNVPANLKHGLAQAYTEATQAEVNDQLQKDYEAEQAELAAAKAPAKKKVTAKKKPSGLSTPKACAPKYTSMTKDLFKAQSLPSGKEDVSWVDGPPNVEYVTTYDGTKVINHDPGMAARIYCTPKNADYPHNVYLHNGTTYGESVVHSLALPVGFEFVLVAVSGLGHRTFKIVKHFPGLNATYGTAVAHVPDLYGKMQPVFLATTGLYWCPAPEMETTIEKPYYFEKVANKIDTYVINKASAVSIIPGPF